MHFFARWNTSTQVPTFGKDCQCVFLGFFLTCASTGFFFQLSGDQSTYRGAILGGQDADPSREILV
jgi:hypothetical protein